MPLVIRTTGFVDYLDKAGGAYIKCLILGAPDTGKTRSASFWPKPIFADCEKGRMSIADRGVPYAEITSSADMDALIEMLRRDCLKAPEQRLYQTLVVDTLDSYQRILIAERLRAERKETLSGWQDWGYLDAKMNHFVERILNLPMNLVVNLHVKDAQDDEILVKQPKLKGDIREQIPADFDLVGLMESGYEAVDGERVKTRTVRWHSEPRFPMLKDRSGRLPRFTTIDFTENDFLRIWEAITQDPSIEAMPESQVLETLETETDALAAPPDLKGGPVATSDATPAPKRAPAKKATPAQKAKKAAVPKAGTYVGEQDVPLAEDPQPSATTEGEERAMERAVEAVSEAMGGEVISTSDQPDEGKEAAPAPAVPVCGDQPESQKGKADPVPGCGKTLADENRDRVNIAVLRTKTMLCASCFEAWKQNN